MHVTHSTVFSATSPSVAWRSLRQCLLRRLGFAWQCLLDRLDLGQGLLGQVLANPLLDTFRLFRAVFFGLIPALLNKSLSALLLWYLLALLDWDFCTFLRGHLPASGFGHVSADFLGSRAAALLWNLLASLMRNLIALGVGHLSANVLGELVAIGAGNLPALGHGQLFTLVNGHWAAGLARQLGTHRVLHQFADLVGNALTLGIRLLLASHFRLVLALLHLDIFTDRPWDLLADRVSHHRANFVGQSNAFSLELLH